MDFSPWGPCILRNEDAVLTGAGKLGLCGFERADQEPLPGGTTGRAYLQEMMQSSMGWLKER